MASIYKKGRDRQRKGSSWYISYVGPDGRRQTVKGCPDKAATEAMARKLETQAALSRMGVVDAKSEAYRVAENRPIAEHLADYRRMLTAKGSGADHAKVTASRIRRVLDGAGIRKLSHLSASKVLDVLASLRDGDGEDEGLNLETINHHIRALKAFSRWLWRDGRLPEHVLAHPSTVNSGPDRRRQRRVLTADESARVVRAAECGPTIMGMTGPLRAMAYRVALATGFRREELKRLTLASFRLDARPPTIVCKASYTKNEKMAEQPIPDPWR
jgi:integrase